MHLKVYLTNKLQDNSQNINQLSDKQVQSLQSFEQNKKIMSRRYNLTRSVTPIADSIQMSEVTNYTPPVQGTQKVVLLSNQGEQAGIARFNISIKRLTVNIDDILPVPVFGILDYESQYAEVLAPYLPPGCTYVLAPTDNNKGLKITYTVGGNSDIIEVTVKEKPYLSLLRGTQTSSIKLSQMKAKITDVANSELFTETIRPLINSLFGMTTSNPFTADDWLRDDQYLQTIRTINQDVDVDAETTVIFNFSPVAENLTLTSTVRQYSTIR